MRALENPLCRIFINFSLGEQREKGGGGDGRTCCDWRVECGEVELPEPRHRNKLVLPPNVCVSLPGPKLDTNAQKL